MENNIEDLIRDDFHKREIQPNANSFERLQMKLEAQATNKHKRVIRVLAYAASFIGLVFILQFVFKNNDSINNSDQVITNVKIKDSSKVPIANENTPIAVEQPQLKELIDELATIKERHKTIIIKEKIAADSQGKLSSKALENKTIEKKLAIIESVDKGSVVFSDTTKKLPITAKEVTDEELDALLATANQSLPKKGRDSIIINARSMLYEIEVEINKPLPEKVLLTIKTGATTIKELVKPTSKENN